jgi:hypothetical protein
MNFKWDVIWSELPRLLEGFWNTIWLCGWEFYYHFFRCVFSNPYGL